MGESVVIGKIVRSESHVCYTCQVSGAGEVAVPPEPADYAFGNFVRIALRQESNRGVSVANSRDAEWWAVGLIYNTVLLNPAFGLLGPRLSNDDQVALFSPDYLSERAVLVSVLLLGAMQPANGRVVHGVPPVAAELGADVTVLEDDYLRAFHYFSDPERAVDGKYLHMGYMPHAVALGDPLLPQAMLATIERLERIFPGNRALLSIVKRNIAWRLKVETAG